MESEKFSFETLDEIYTGDEKTLSRSKEYIHKYFFKINNGDHYFWDAPAKSFICYNQIKMYQMILPLFPDELSKWYKKKNTRFYRLDCNTGEPVIYKNDKGEHINKFPGFKHSRRPYNSYPESVQFYVQIMLSFLLEVWANGSTEHYEFILKWLSVVCKGGKNSVILYLKTSDEGTGKSTFTSFFIKYVLGDKISKISSASPFTSDHNGSLAGQLFICFEELPAFSSFQWEVTSSKLKAWATNGHNMDYEDKYEKVYQALNINNYVLNTNVDAIKNSEGRRYFELDVSSKRLNDFKYFGKINDMCYNDEVGEAFFNYLLEIDTTGFVAITCMPETKAKQDAIADRLPIEYKYLKDTYILTETNLNGTVDDIYTEYSNYCEDIEKKPLTKIKFCQKLRQNLNIDFKKSNGINRYFVSFTELKEIADKRLWIHALDTFKSDGEKKEIGENGKILKGNINYSELEKLYKSQVSKNEGYEMKIKELEEKLIDYGHLKDRISEVEGENKLLLCDLKKTRTKNVTVNVNVNNNNDNDDTDDDNINDDNEKKPSVNLFIKKNKKDVKEELKEEKDIIEEPKEKKKKKKKLYIDIKTPLPEGVVDIWSN